MTTSTTDMSPDSCVDLINGFRIEIEKRKVESQQYDLMKQIDEWEFKSIEKIRHLANQIRHEFSSSMSKFLVDFEFKLEQLSQKVVQYCQQQYSMETDMAWFMEKFNRLKDDFQLSSCCKLSEDSTSFINRIHLTMTTPFLRGLALKKDTKWIQDGVTAAGRNEHGDSMNRFYFPFGVYVNDDDDDQTIYVVDSENHRIIEWQSGATMGRTVAGGKRKGDRLDQLNRPLDLVIDKEHDSFIISDYNNKRLIRWARRNAMHGEAIISNIGCWGLATDNDGFLYVVDHDQHEVKRYRVGCDQGTVVAGGNGQGNRLDQLCYPTYVFVDQDRSVYVSDLSNHRVMKWIEGATQGIVVAGGECREQDALQLSNPNGIFVDHSGMIYVADGGNNRIMRWVQGEKYGSVIVGGNGYGSQSNQLTNPSGLSFDRQGNIYVCDRGNHRIQKFSMMNETS